MILLESDYASITGKGKPLIRLANNETSAAWLSQIQQGSSLPEALYLDVSSGELSSNQLRLIELAGIIGVPHAFALSDVQYVDKVEHQLASFKVTLASSRKVSAFASGISCFSNANEIPDDVLCSTHQQLRENKPLQQSAQLSVFLWWDQKVRGYAGRQYRFVHQGNSYQGTILEVKKTYSPTSFAQRPAKRMQAQQRYRVTIDLGQSISFHSVIDGFAESVIEVLGDDNQRLGCGVIQFPLRRSQNVFLHQQSVSLEDRAHIKGHDTKVYWFTGLSGSGKSTLANAFECALNRKGIHTYLLDGDNVRHGLNKDLGFTQADRVENIRRIAEVAKLMSEAGLVVLTAFISPMREERQFAKALIGEDRFVEVFVDTPLSVAEQRDPKGLYKKARKGEIPNFTGIDSPYEAPTNPDLRIDTSAERVEISIQKLLENFTEQKEIIL